MTNVPKIFDNRKLKIHKDRASKQFLENNFLFEEIDERNLQRILEIRENYKNILLIGFSSNELITNLKHHYKSSSIFIADISTKFVDNAFCIEKIICSNEILPFKEDSFDLIIASPHCCFVNDLPMLLLQVKNILKEKGVFIASFFTANNLYELKDCLQQAEIEVKNGFSPRFSPLVEMQSIAGLIQKIGFLEPVTDIESIKVSYDNITQLMYDLRFTALNNCINSSISPLNKNILRLAQQIYTQKYNDRGDAIIATYNLVNITGLK